jgi:hypothetical protein
LQDRSELAGTEPFPLTFIFDLFRQVVF